MDMVMGIRQLEIQVEVEIVLVKKRKRRTPLFELEKRDIDDDSRRVKLGVGLLS